MIIYLVKFLYKENEILDVNVIDEEGMNEDEIVTEAQVNLQREGLKFSIDDLDLLSCELIGGNTNE